uniref:Outer membrane immunogenic protein n=1 Tax=Candidatus Kentrum sp. DK TaxID=2126562 RepID=A0A450SXB5_9GAMM|nr:MAG: outer membrane immunogenic protein [Candidatus Kentron sp. DK]
MKKLTGFFAVGLCMAIAANASATEFDGPYVGITLAMDHFNTEYTYEDGNTGNGDASVDGLGADGANFGGIAGYEKQFGSNVIGIEANFDYSNAETTLGISALKAERTLGLSLRLGRVLSQSTLLYGKLGWVNTNFEAKVGANSEDEDLNGFVIGAGIELALDEIKLRAEYTFAGYEDIDFVNSTTGETGTYEPGRGQFLVSVKYNF